MTALSQDSPNPDIKMSNLIELLSDLALLESTPSDMDHSALSLIFNMKEQLDDFLADLTTSAPLAATPSHNDEYSMVSTSRLIQLGHD